MQFILTEESFHQSGTGSGNWASVMAFDQLRFDTSAATLPDAHDYVDIGNPAAPRIVGSCPVEGFANHIRVSGTHAYVSDEAFGLLKIDVGSPEAPKLVARFETPGESAAVSLWGEHILIADSFSLIVVK